MGNGDAVKCCIATGGWSARCCCTYLSSDTNKHNVTHISSKYKWEINKNIKNYKWEINMCVWECVCVHVHTILAACVNFN